MEIKFLGTGSAFVLGKENYQSNILISKDIEYISENEDGLNREKVKKHLLYDCGTTISDALDEFNIKPQDLDTIYISHLHADHAGGIEYIAFKTYFETFNYGKQFGTMRPKLKGHRATIYNGWEHTWKGGLESIQDATNTLESYFDTTYMADNENFDFYGTEIKPLQTVHVMADRSINPSYGLMFDDDEINVLITGDVQFQSPNQLQSFFNRADIIFHDCEFANYPNSVHAQFHQLCTLDEKTKRKMWLYHYSLNGKTFEELESEVKNAGFGGLIKKGQTFNTRNIADMDRIS